MDFALETGTAAQASHRIILKRHGWLIPYTRFHVQERRKFLWLIPHWADLDDFCSRSSAEDWLLANWKVPAYFHITRKTPA